MKKLTPEQIAQSKEQYQFLTAVKELIKTNELRDEGFEKLSNIDSDSLSIQNQVYYYYIKGKYYVLTFKESKNKDLEVLAYGNDAYSDMVSIAFKNGVPMSKPKLHFARAYCKYLIAQHHSSDEVKVKLLAKVKQISDRVLCAHPSNSSFLWLNSAIAE